MPRRVSLPGASELFRPTDATDPAVAPDGADQPARPARKTTRRKAVVPPFEEALAPEVRRRAASPRLPLAESEQERPEAEAAQPEVEVPRPAPKASPRAAAKKAASGRIRHDEKITVYVSTDELLALETARLTLRGEHGLAADRGRIVRESIAIVMADLAAHGADSELVRRLGDA